MTTPRPTGRSATALLATAALAGALALTACSSGGGTASPSSPSSTATSSTPPSSPSTTATAAPGASATASGDTAVDQRAVQALLPDGAMQKVGFGPASQAEQGVFAWYDPCSGKLPSNAQITGGAHARWTDGPLTLDQVVAAYPAGVAADAVQQAKSLTTCTSWTLKDGSVVTKVAAHPVKTVDGVSAQFGWCEAIKALTRCTAAVAAADSVSRVWVLAPTAKVAQQTLDTFATIAAARLLSQPR